MADVPSKVMPEPENTSGPVEQREQREKVAEAKAVEEAKVEVKQEAKGSHTPDTRLYAALEEERKARRALEQRLTQIESSAPSQTAEVDDELRGQVDSLKGEILSLKDSLAMEKVYAVHPEIKERSEDFAKFRAERPSTDLDEVAVLWKAKHGLLGVERKGLEKPSAGPKESPKADFSEDEIQNLRENYPRKFAKMIQSGVLQ